MTDASSQTAADGCHIESATEGMGGVAGPLGVASEEACADEDAKKLAVLRLTTVADCFQSLLGHLVIFNGDLGRQQAIA